MIDVTVIVAVHNTMPYLTDCLNSLIDQSIGLDRMEVIAVDDGSTDGGDKELDRIAELYPLVFTIIHQENSGGPAGPSNRALEIAQGRYVFFLGADDHLGAEALERMVGAADEYGSDVLLGRVEGANGRHILQDVYRHSTPDLDLYDSALPWSLSNTKLFRRALIEEHGLRFPESMRILSDQPFTIAACVHAARISVLADYTCYYAVRRDGDANLTYTAAPVERMHAARSVMEATAALLEPGTRRDFVLKRHFAWELGKLLRKDFLDYSAATQVQLCSGIAELADRFLTPGVREQLTVRQRLRLSLCQRGAVDTLREHLRRDSSGDLPPLLVDGDALSCCFPGFGDERLDLPADCFTVTGSPAPFLTATDCVARWERDTLTIRARTSLLGMGPALWIGLARPRRGAKAARHLPEGPPFPLGQVVPRSSCGTLDAVLDIPTMLRHRIVSPQLVCLYVQLAGSTYEIPLPAPRAGLAPLRRWYKGRRYLLTPGTDEHGQMLVTVARCGVFGRKPA